MLLWFSFQETDPPVLFFHVGEVASRHYVYVQKETAFMKDSICSLTGHKSASKIILA